MSELKIKRNHSAFFILLLFFLNTFNLASQEMIRVGVVEFEEKNDIGLENAGVIVAEWVITELQKIGVYEVEERLFLEAILEEQQLMLSGIIDEDQAPEIGKIYGVEALLTGSVMKVGDQISVTGRIINTTTGKVLKTASLTTGLITELEKEVTVLANELSDVSRDEWEIREDLAKREAPRLEVGGGVGYGFDNMDYGGFNLSAHLRFNSKRFLLWIDGAPLGGIKSIEFGAVFNFIPFIGAGASFGMVFDDLLNFASSQYLTFGVVGRPRYNMELGIFLGFSTGGRIWTDDSGEIDGIDPYFTFPGNYQVWFNWRLFDYLVLYAKYVGTELGNLEDQLPPGYYYPTTDYEFLTGRFTIGVLYSYAIGK